MSRESVWEPLLDALKRGDNIELCEQDHEALSAYLKRREAPAFAGILSDVKAVRDAFGHVLRYESQGGWGE